MNRSSGLQEALHAAMNSSTPDEIVDGVKSIVSSEISGLDSSMEIEFTGYFNHTYMPDMVISWKGSDDSRPLYIRNRINSDVTAAEIRGLGSKEPVVLSLATADSDTAETVRASMGRIKHGLVTDVASVNSIASKEAAGSGSPIMEVVRSSLLRIGRGILDTDDAATLSDAASRAISTESDVAARGLEDLERAASRVYAEDGLHQISRVGQLIQSVAAGNVNSGFESASGRLSPAEARILIPYMLNRDDISVDSPVWRRLSSLIDLTLIEDMDELDGLDLDRLMTSEALDNWTVTRAMLVATADDEMEKPRGSWFLRSGLLTAKVDHWLVLFTASDKRRLKGRADSLSANWEDIAPVVRPLIVDSADLRGLSRRVAISTEESGNVVRDITSLTENIPDNYRVTSLGVRIPGSESDASIEIEFEKMMASVSAGALPVGEVGTAALLLLGHRYPVKSSWQRIGNHDADEN